MSDESTRQEVKIRELNSFAGFFTRFEQIQRHWDDQNFNFFVLSTLPRIIDSILGRDGGAPGDYST
jgi:hypothetical protein